MTTGVSGVLSFYSSESDTFTVETLGLLMEMAGELAFGISALRHRSGVAEDEKTLVIPKLVFYAQLRFPIY